MDSHLEIERLALTDITLCEVLQGIAKPRDMRQVEQLLLGFPILTTGGTDLAQEAAANYRHLRRRGFTVRKTIDCWIATFCLRAGHALLHSDRDFLPFEEHLGLQVLHPT